MYAPLWQRVLPSGSLVAASYCSSHLGSATRGSGEAERVSRVLVSVLGGHESVFECPCRTDIVGVLVSVPCGRSVSGGPCQADSKEFGQ